MHLADEAGRTSARRPNPARVSKPTTTVADLPRTDAEVVFVVCHETTIGSRNASGKRENAVVANNAGADRSRGFPIILRRVDLILSGYKGIGSPPAQRPTIFVHGNLELHRDSKRVLWEGNAVGLTATEFIIVDYLVSRAGHDVRYRELYDVVRGEGFIAGSGEAGYRVNVRTFIKRIRQKFQAVDPEFAHIENYLGFGYRWSEVDGPSPPFAEGV